MSEMAASGAVEGKNKLPLAWAGVTLVGVIVVILVVLWQLFPRLFAAQGMVDGLGPAFPAIQVQGARAGTEMVSSAVDLGDPAMYPGRADAEMPAFIDFIGQQIGLSRGDTQAMLRKDYPYINGFLSSMPLSAVSADVTGMVHYLGTVLFMTPGQVNHMLETDYPAIYEVSVNLPKLIAGWDDIPGTEDLTTWQGAPVRTMPQLRDYLSHEVVAPVERQQANFRPLADWFGVAYIAPLLLALGIAVTLFGATMMALTRRGVRNGSRLAWVGVSVIGVVVVGLVLVINAFPRFIGGQELLDDTRPLFALDRIEGDRSGVQFISVYVKALGGAVLPDGGVAEEYPKLYAHVAKEVGIPVQDVSDLVHQDFPNAAALLDGVPFSDSTADATKLVDYLASQAHVTSAQMWDTLRAKFPKIYQVVTSLRTVTDGWKQVPGTEGLTRFDGTPARSVPDVRDYFLDDIIAGLVAQQKNFVTVDTNFPPLPVFAPLLTVLGTAVVCYGFLIGAMTRRQLRRQDNLSGPLATAPDVPIPAEAR